MINLPFAKVNAFPHWDTVAVDTTTLRCLNWFRLDCHYFRKRYLPDMFLINVGLGWESEIGRYWRLLALKKFISGLFGSLLNKYWWFRMVFSANKNMWNNWKAHGVFQPQKDVRILVQNLSKYTSNSFSNIDCN